MLSLSKHGAWGIANYALAVMHSVQAFALTLRVPQSDTHFINIISLFYALISYTHSNNQKPSP